MSFYCGKCGKVRESNEMGGRIPGVSQICIYCLNERMKVPENRAVGSAELQSRRPDPLKPLPSEKLAKGKRGRPMRRRKMGVSLTGLLPARSCSRPGSSRLAPIGASV